MTINVLLDVNIVLDLLLKRGPNYYRGDLRVLAQRCAGGWPMALVSR